MSASLFTTAALCGLLLFVALLFLGCAIPVGPIKPPRILYLDHHTGEFSARASVPVDFARIGNPADPQ